MALVANYPQLRRNQKSKRSRNKVACQRCRKRKIKCERAKDEEEPCSACSHPEVQAKCIYERVGTANSGVLKHYFATHPSHQHRSRYRQNSLQCLAGNQSSFFSGSSAYTSSACAAPQDSYLLPSEVTAEIPGATGYSHQSGLPRDTLPPFSQILPRATAANEFRDLSQMPAASSLIEPQSSHSEQINSGVSPLPLSGSSQTCLRGPV